MLFRCAETNELILVEYNFNNPIHEAGRVIHRGFMAWLFGRVKQIGDAFRNQWHEMRRLQDEMRYEVV